MEFIFLTVLILLMLYIVIGVASLLRFDSCMKIRDQIGDELGFHAACSLPDYSEMMKMKYWRLRTKDHWIEWLAKNA